MSAAPTLEVEQSLFAAGHKYVAGVDEVGRGALAGPVSVGIAVVSAEVGEVPAKLRDSKVISRKVREELIEPVSAWVIDSAIGHASAAEIDEIGIVSALRLAWTRAHAGLKVKPHAVILDGKHNWIAAPRSDLFTVQADVIDVPVTMQIKADALCASVSAASVLAKVERDAMMREYAVTYPEFGFEGHVGYGAATHLRALSELGPTEIHRKSWNLPTGPQG